MYLSCCFIYIKTIVRVARILGSYCKKLMPQYVNILQQPVVAALALLIQERKTSQNRVFPIRPYAITSGWWHPHSLINTNFKRRIHNCARLLLKGRSFSRGGYCIWMYVSFANNLWRYLIRILHFQKENCSYPFNSLCERARKRLNPLNPLKSFH